MKVRAEHAADVAQAQAPLAQLDSGELEGVLRLLLGEVESPPGGAGMADQKLERCLQLDVDGDLDVVHGLEVLAAWGPPRRRRASGRAPAVLGRDRRTHVS